MGRQLFLYGLAGAEGSYRIVRYCYLEDEAISNSNIKYNAIGLMQRNPTIKHVYMIDNRAGLAKQCHHAMKSGLIDDAVLFRLMLEREGTKLDIQI